jgi:hypothetical protein
LKGIFGPPVKCPLVKVSLAVNEGERALFFPTEILCAVAEGLNDQMLIPPKIFKQLKKNACINREQIGKEVSTTDLDCENASDNTEDTDILEISDNRERRKLVGVDSETAGEKQDTNERRVIGPIEPPSAKGHKYILCLVDQHTRCAEAVPFGNLNTKTTFEALLNSFSRTGIPSLIASDNGTDFNFKFHSKKKKEKEKKKKERENKRVNK